MDYEGKSNEDNLSIDFDTLRANLSSFLNSGVNTVYKVLFRWYSGVREGKQRFSPPIG